MPAKAAAGVERFQLTPRAGQKKKKVTGTKVQIFWYKRGEVPAHTAALAKKKKVPLRQYFYFCASKASEMTNIGPPLRQYLYFCSGNGVSTCTFVPVKLTKGLPLHQYSHCCTSKASKLNRAPSEMTKIGPANAKKPSLRQYLYFCTSKASKAST